MSLFAFSGRSKTQECPEQVSSIQDHVKLFVRKDFFSELRVRTIHRDVRGNYTPDRTFS